MNNTELICAYSGLPSLSSFQLAQEKKVATKKQKLSIQDIDRIIQMAWEDRTPFEAITFQFGLKENEVIDFMRKNSLPSSFRMWRKRMTSRKTKHLSLRNASVSKFKCSRQRSTGNKISKR